MRHIRRATNWGAWPTGPLKAKTEMDEEEDNNITGTTEVKSNVES